MNKTTYERVSEWNKRCSNTPYQTGTDEYWKSLSNQAARIEEELQELKDAITNKDTLEVFDALLDLDVVVAGGLYLSNGDYEKGVNAVLDNNDRKYTRILSKAEIIKEYYTLLGTKTEVCGAALGGTFDYFSVHRIEDNKIMKFPNHPKVDLTSFAPKEEL